MRRASLILTVTLIALLSFALLSNYGASAINQPASSEQSALVSGLTTQLQSDNAAQRADAAVALGGIESREATTALLSNLGDSDPTAGYQTARSLSQSDAAIVADSLIAELSNPDATVRQRAALALSEMAVPAAVPALTNALNDSNTSLFAAQALVKINDTSAQDALLVALADKELTTRRHAAMAAIEQADRATAQHLLGRALASDDLVLRSNAMMLRDLLGLG